MRYTEVSLDTPAEAMDVRCDELTSLGVEGFVIENEADFHARVDSFMSISFLSGEGEVDHIPFHRGDTFFIPANKKAHIEGNGKYILTEVK